MTGDLYNSSGQKVCTVDLPEQIFTARWNADLVHQTLRAQAINTRRPWAHVKDRGEVSGGGKKPWRQKGTGRARHGSIRSPIWKGGGVTHGPTKNRAFALKINRVAKQKAVYSVLARKWRDGEVRIVESIEIAEPKTKLLANWLKEASPGKSVLMVVGSENKNVFRAIRNLPRAKAISACSLNVYDLLRPAVVLIDRRALGEIERSTHTDG